MTRLYLRGHHLLCVQGFQGMGYSDYFVVKMNEIVNELRDEELDFPITVVAGFDNACMACPNRGERVCEASIGSQKHVLSMDIKVLNHLGLMVGKKYQKSKLMELVAMKVKPDDLDFLCKGCSWLQYGVCKQGILELKEKWVSVPLF
ncbi:DUF1284 domain-containing protein [Bacillus sp. DNRA2]|uniref:DUF1284 domain-containing protein n=1 Tax=Bacillus sp. DNRA2 TaxID=2723053 RepID=UPI00145F05EB|nr:DUF1284 domain-containing protein [Bacillus sp. DNRA2]